MSFLRYALPAAAIVGTAFAQGCSAPTTTIQSGADASGLSSCKTFTGNVAISTAASGIIDFGNLGSIDGDLSAVNSVDVSTIQGNGLESITGDFTMTNMTTLFTLSMPQLSSVGSIDWTTVNNLQNASFGSGLQTVKRGLSIQDTALQSLDSINVKEISGMAVVANNNQLETLKWQLRQVGNLSISSNGPQGNTGLNLSLPDLVSAGSLDINNVSSISLGSFSNCSGAINVRSSSIKSLEMSDLTTSRDISVRNNPSLTGVSFPMLKSTVGSIALVNNDKLGGDIEFPALTQLRGAVNITGAFDSVSMPKINTIGGTVYLWSTQDISSTCDTFNGVNIRGKLPNGSGSKGIVCRSKSDSASAGSGTSGGSSSKTSNPAVPAHGFVASPAALFGATGLFAAMLGMM